MSLSERSSSAGSSGAERCAARGYRAVAAASLLLGGAWLAAAAALAAGDPAAIEVQPGRSQTAEQMRRDRYECHLWAVEQTGTVPQRYDAESEEHERRGERVDKVITGAGIGAAVGAIVRGNDSRGRDAADGALGGAAIGAAIGAIVGRDRRDKREEAADEAFDAYFRAISACLEGRGYTVSYAEADAG